MSGISSYLLPGVSESYVRQRLEAADGKEFKSGKFYNPDSSSALAVNCFAWFAPRPHDLPGFPGVDFGFPAKNVTVEFQARFPWSGGRHPWLDAGIVTETHLVGIEAKRFEPFRDSHSIKLSDAYDRPVWGERMNPFESLRDDLRNGVTKYRHLDAVQLVKHGFGLVTEARRHSLQPALLYLYAEPKELKGKPISHHAIELHRTEIRDFATKANGAEVEFYSMSYRDWISSWPGRHSCVFDHGQSLLETFSP